MTSVHLVALGREAMLALLEDDLATASAAAGIPLTDFYTSDDITWLWRIREKQIAENPQSENWAAFVVIDDETGAPVGHAGFHGPPDAAGLVEIGYSIDPRMRLRGFAKATVAALLTRVADDDSVITVRATISPDNAASLATIAGYGFARNGEQWDEEDGLEWIFDYTKGATHD